MEIFKGYGISILKLSTFSDYNQNKEVVMVIAELSFTTLKVINTNAIKVIIDDKAFWFTESLRSPIRSHEKCYLMYFP